jgi:hypothetical protein
MLWSHLPQTKRYPCAIPPPRGDFPLFFKGKKHWLAIEFTDVADLPQGYVYIQLDKNNQRQILSALGSGTGIEIEQIIED